MGIIWRTLYVVGRKKWMFFHRLLSYWFIFPSDVFSQKLFYFVFINLFIILNMPQKRPSTLFYFLCFFCKDGVLPRCSLYGTLPIPYQDGDWLNHNDKRTRQWQSSPESMSLPRSTDFPLTWRSNEKKVQRGSDNWPHEEKDCFLLISRGESLTGAHFPSSVSCRMTITTLPGRGKGCLDMQRPREKESPPTFGRGEFMVTEVWGESIYFLPVGWNTT